MAPRIEWLAVMSCGESDSKSKSMREPVMVTRSECGNTPKMEGNLTCALRELRLPEAYRVVSLDALPRTDVLTGFPAPTLLYRGRGLFGMPEPQPPFPDPA